MVLSVQSANVDLVCKAHKIIHTKAHYSLHTKTVHILLFLYINIRLLKKCSDDYAEFLTQYLNTIDSESRLKKTVSLMIRMLTPMNMSVSKHTLRRSTSQVHVLTFV